MNGVAAFAAVVAASMLMAILGERVRVPAAVVLVGGGLAASAALHVEVPFPFGGALLVVFLPPIVFEAAWNLDISALRENAPRIAFLAFPGTLFTVFAIALAVALAGGLAFGPALLLGSAIAATDPVAVVAVFRRIVAVPQRVATIVEAESILNDGVAAVVFVTTLEFVSAARPSLGHALGAAVWAVAAGALAGAVVAAIVTLVLRLTRAFEYEVTLTLLLAYGAYVTATAIGASGIIATAVAGVTLRAAFIRDPEALSNDAAVDGFWRAAAFAANGMVFVATGLIIDLPRALHEPLLAAVAVGVVLAARALLAMLVMSDTAGRATVFFAGMRGALPLALVLSLPATLAGRPAIVDAVFAVVVVTLIVQGAALEPVLRGLYSRNGGPSPSS